MTAEEKLVEIPLMEIKQMGIDMRCLDVGKVRRYGIVYRNDCGQRFNFSGAYDDDARDTIIFRFET